LFMSPNHDKTTGTDENNSKYSLAELQKKYGISRDALYKRMKYLQIVTWKETGSNRVYLDSQQVVYLDELHVHMQENQGKMDGYLVPEPSGPQAIVATSSENVVVAEKPEEVIEEVVEQVTNGRKHSQDVEDLQSIHSSGMRRAFGIMMMERAIANQYIANPDLLPEEFKEQLAQASKIPEIDPFAFTASLKTFLDSNGAVS